MERKAGLKARDGLLGLAQLHAGHVGEAPLIGHPGGLHQELEHRVLLQEGGAGHVHIQGQHAVPRAQALAVPRPNLHHERS